MKNNAKKLIKNEDGQVMVLFVLLIVILLGFVALVIDGGMIHYSKVSMQNVADAAALAGAQDLPNTGKAISVAENLAEFHGVDKSNVVVTTPYEGNSKRIKVVVTENVKFSFARVLGFTDTNISKHAVAKKIPKWDGEALPFINLDDDYEDIPEIEAWEKTGPGDFESLWPGNNPPSEYEMFNLGKNDDHSNGYFTVNYHDGITVTKGTVATIKQEVGYVYEQAKPVYIFSLSSAVIKENKYNKIKNKDVIPIEDLVLLQVTFDSYDYSGKTLFLTVTGVYDFNNGIFPTEYLNEDSIGTSSLVE